MARTTRGFTLVELMVTLAVLAALIMVAVPSFNTITLTQRVKTASFDIVAHLSYARSEALKQNRNVTITPSSGTTSWASGWAITYVDADGVTQTLKTQAAFQSLTITGPTSLVYGRSGRVASGTGNIDIASSIADDAVPARCITIDVTGLPRAKPGSCS